MTAHVPDKPALEGLEAKWDAEWTEKGTYLFPRDGATRETVYSIDTPPPTASGSLHIGHVFSYTHTDVIARYQRMTGKRVFYPIGWDDNGLPTERRVQNYYGVRCDPTLPYDPDFTPPFEGGDNKSSKAADQIPISRRNFIELCEVLTVEDEKQFESLWRDLGLSVDWTQTYRTISRESQAASQLAFLRNIERGEAYQAMAPTLWDVTFRTAVAQAELEDKEQPGAVIDGLSGEQRLYLGWAQVWRTKARDAQQILLIKTDTHSPGQFRGNGTLKNQPGFYSAFGVKEGDKMYLKPEERVSIW